MLKKSTLSLIFTLLFGFFCANVSAEVVNINEANSAALQLHLTGIGPVKADAIIKYRNKHGSFKSIEELKNVPGIGSEILDSNRKSLSLNSGVKEGDPLSTKKALDEKKESAKVEKDKKQESTKKDG